MASLVGSSTITKFDCDERWFEAMSTLAKDNGFEIVLRTSDKDSWDQALESSGHAPAHLTNAALNFQCATNADRVARFLDLSCTVWDSGLPIAAWPLGVVWDIHGSGRLSTCGLEYYALLLSTKIAPKTTQRLMTLVSKAHEIVSEAVESINITIRHTWRPSSRQSPWMRYEREILNPHFEICDEMLVDLAKPFEEIYSKFRKSYRPLVKRAEALWSYETMTVLEPQTWKEFEQLHISVSGRRTRSSNSWSIQSDAFSTGNGLLTTIRNPDGALIGAGFFFLSPHEATYAVAAYRRDLFSMPLGHGLQARTIRTLQSLGIPWYVLGTYETASQNSNLSEKERSIISFKKGFATQIETSFRSHLDLRWKK